MGHNRLGPLPDTAPWRRVVGAIADGDSAAGVAAATTDAATDGLDKAKADPGLARAVYLLARTALAAREPDFPAALAADGVHVPHDPGLFDLTAAVLTAVHDWYAATRTRRSDLGEMAALAATEALARCAGDRAGEMFPDGGEGLPDAADPPGGYERDVLTGERDGAALTFVERYVGTALDLEGVPTAVRFAARYGEVNQAIPYVGRPAGAAAEALFDLHRRHAEGVRGVVARELAARTGDLIRQAFPAGSLLGVVIGRAARRPADAAAAIGGDRPAAGGRFVLDGTRFEARCGGEACALGNSNEYWVVHELAKDPGGCVSVAALRKAVWADAVVEKNTIQKTVGNARRKLRRLPGVTITPLKDHYRLVLPPG